MAIYHHNSIRHAGALISHKKGTFVARRKNADQVSRTRNVNAVSVNMHAFAKIKVEGYVDCITMICEARFDLMSSSEIEI